MRCHAHTALGRMVPVLDVDGTHKEAYCRASADQWERVHLRRATEADPREKWIGSVDDGWWVPDETRGKIVMPKGWTP